MKRVIIICEGKTEQGFCNDVLVPYFSQQEIFLQTPTIGGITRWEALKKRIERHLLADPTAFVTMLVDYYGIYAYHGYPRWDEAEQKTNHNERMDILESGMENDMPENLKNRFKAYVQLHEFEGLLFSDISAFDRRIAKEKFADYPYLESTIREHSNPETINKGTETFPSKRLKKIIRNYDKVLHGTLLAQEIGLTKIREKCPRFNNWILQIENLKF
jgi:hypothetical protein